MDKQFDERLTKVENILSRIEKTLGNIRLSQYGPGEIPKVHSDLDNEDYNEIYIEDLSEDNVFVNNSKVNEPINRKYEEILSNCSNSTDNNISLDDVTEKVTIHELNTNSLKTINEEAVASTMSEGCDDVSCASKENLEKDKIDIIINQLRNVKVVDKDCINKQREKEAINLEQSSETVLENINMRLLSIESLLKGISISVERFKPKGCYKNWSAKHQVILSFAFVPKDAFSNMLWTMSRQMDNYYTGVSSVNRLFDTLPAFRVSRTCRFPDDGVYVNLTDYDIYNYIQRIREAAHCQGLRGAREGGKEVFQTALALLHNLVSCNSDEPRVHGILHEMDTFEKHYGLEWSDE